MIRLGNIAFSNCYPIHARVLEGDRPRWLSVTDGPPNELNRMLADGRLDVAPSSSVELARHPRSYRVLAGLCIGSDGPVESIILVSRAPLRELGGAVVALPTASATSSVMARILLGRLGVEPVWADFDQGSSDPVRDGSATAALFIGDAALRLSSDPGDLRIDLGFEWTSWTGLPFVYALWHVREPVVADPRIAELHRRFLAARDGLPAAGPRLAERAQGRFRIPAERLAAYWKTVRYRLDARMLEGLGRFYELAAEAGLIEGVPEVRLVE